MITARASRAGVEVEVGPGGRLHRLSIPPKAMRLGGEALATLVLDLVRTATAQANQRARLAWPADDLGALGLRYDLALTDAVEHTTPDTWMR